MLESYPCPLESQTHTGPGLYAFRHTDTRACHFPEYGAKCGEYMTISVSVHVLQAVVARTWYLIGWSPTMITLDMKDAL